MADHKLPTFEMAGSGGQSFDFFEPGPEEMGPGPKYAVTAPRPYDPTADIERKRAAIQKRVEESLEPGEVVEAGVDGSSFPPVLAFGPWLILFLGNVILAFDLPFAASLVATAAVIVTFIIFARGGRVVVSTSSSFYVLGPTKRGFGKRPVLVKGGRGSAPAEVGPTRFGYATLLIGDQKIYFRTFTSTSAEAEAIAAAASGSPSS